MFGDCEMAPKNCGAGKDWASSRLLQHLGVCGAQRIGFQLVGKVAQGLDPAGLGLVHSLLDGREHVMPVAAGLEPDLLQRQALFVDHLQGLAVLQHALDAHMVALIQQAGFP